MQSLSLSKRLIFDKVTTITHRRGAIIIMAPFANSPIDERSTVVHDSGGSFTGHDKKVMCPFHGHSFLLGTLLYK